MKQILSRVILLAIAMMYSPLIAQQSNFSFCTLDAISGVKLVPDEIEIVSNNDELAFGLSANELSSMEFVNVSIPPSNYRITIRKKGFKTLIFDKEVTSSNVLASVGKVYLTPAEKWGEALNDRFGANPQSLNNQLVLKGLVTDELGDQLSNVNVEINIGNQEHNLVSDLNGNYLLTVLQNQTSSDCTITFSKPGYIERTYSFEVEQEIMILSSPNLRPVQKNLNKVCTSLKLKSNSISNKSASSCEIPSSITVGLDCSGTDCDSWATYDLDVYVAKVLTSEWVSSWTEVSGSEHSFQAGSTAIRSYACQAIQAQNFENYDICSNTYCQVFNPLATPWVAEYDAVVTTSEYLVLTSFGGEVAKCEYAAETNDLSATSNGCNYPFHGECGDGFFQKSVTGPPCNSGGCFPNNGTLDYVSLGYFMDGHPRGMSQRGSMRWATGFEVNEFNQVFALNPILPAEYLGMSYATKSWQQILAHYYPYWVISNCSTGNECGLTINSTSAEVCSGGLVTLFAEDGTEPYVFTGPEINATNQNSVNIYPTESGTYTVTDSEGCSAEILITVFDSPNIILNINPPDGLIELGQSADASADVTGNGPFMYYWDGENVSNPNGDQTFVAPMSTGLYTLTVTDVNGCESDATFTIDVSQPSDEPDLTPCLAMCNNVGSNIVLEICVANIGGEASESFTVEYGLVYPGSQTFAASDFVSFSSISAGDSDSQIVDISTEFDQQFWEVPVGEYSLCYWINESNAAYEEDFTNNFGCTDCIINIEADIACENLWIQSQTIESDNSLPFYFDIVNVGETFINQNVDWIVVISNDESYSDDDFQIFSSNTDLNIHVGEEEYSAYNVITNFNSVPLGEWYFIVYVDPQPNDDLDEIIEVENNLCAIPITVIAEGTGCNGFLPFADVDDPDDGDVFCTGEPIFLKQYDGCNSCTFSYDMGNGDVVIGNEQLYSYDSPGEYLVTLTTSNACGSASDAVGITVLPAITTTSVINHDYCNDCSGSINVEVLNATSETEYYWTDAPDGLPSVEGLCAGSYNLIINHVCGDEIVINYEVLGGNGSPILSPIIQNENCQENDGSIILEVTSGQPPYSFLWSNGEVTQSLLGISAGEYEVLVSDANGCSTNFSATIESVCLGCTDAEACNYNQEATDEDDSCLYLSGCLNEMACNFNPNAECDDGSCDFESCLGCTLSFACNYNQDATQDDGSCEFISCAGCSDSDACNYDEDATINDGSCVFPDGCVDPQACNYDLDALCDNGSCEYTSGWFDCDGNCLNDCDSDGVCDEEEIAGCTYVNASNFDPLATEDNGTCMYSICIYGCTYEASMNYDSAATCDDGSCTFLECAYGCTYSNASNYNVNASCDDGSCEFCLGDINYDGLRNAADLLAFLGVFGMDCD